MADASEVSRLVRASASGDETAWNELVCRYSPLVMAVTRTYQLTADDAKDVSQTVWLRLVENLANLREPDALPGWLATTTQRECIRQLRQGRRVLPVDPHTDAALQLCETVDPDTDILRAELHQALRDGLADLPARDQALLKLRAADPPKSYEEISQLLGMLIKGTAKDRIRTSEVRRLRCTDHLKEIVYRCLGERRKRYQSADELIEALRNPPASLKAGVLRSLKGVHLAFTGVLSRKRIEAARAAKRAGAVVHGAPSARTTVVVRGRPNPLQAGGADGGRKLIEIKRLREKGYKITLLNEAQFWRLAGDGARTRSPRRRSASRS